MMKRLSWLGALALVVLLPASAWAQAGDAAAGKAFWTGAATLCRQCHGANGEGGFGPDLAGRALTAPQFARAVRQPWGVMPAFTVEQVSDRQVADLVAFFDSLPKVAEPAAWRVPLTPSMPAGQQLATAHGCTQCHGPELAVMRAALGAVQLDYASFTRLVYDHTTAMPDLDKMLGDTAPTRMGNFSRLRLPEPVVQELWKYLATDLGFRARVQARVEAGTPAAGGTPYTVTVNNRGLRDKGPAAEDVTVALTLPAGTTVASTTGAGYQGTKKNDNGLDVATWRVPRIGATESQTFTITLGGSAPLPQAGTVNWVKPASKNGAAGDTVNIVLPPRPAPPQ